MHRAKKMVDWRYSFRHSTLALNGFEWSASRPDRFTTGKEPPVRIGQDAAWAPDTVWTW